MLREALPAGRKGMTRALSRGTGRVRARSPTFKLGY